MPRRSLAYFTPTQLTGLVAWFKADSLVLSDADPVSTWADSGSGANDATQGTGGNQPTYRANVINGKPVVRFDGGDGLVVANESNFDIATPTIFFVATRSSGSGVLMGKSTTGFSDGRRRKLQFVLTSATNFRAASGADGTQFDTTVTSTSVPAIYVYRSSSDTSHDVSYNGSSTASTTTLSESSSNFNDASLILGSNFAAGTESFTGDIAEIIIFNRYLSDEESFGVQNYLSNKYDIKNDVIGGYPRTAVANRRLLGGTSLSFSSGTRVQVKSSAILSGSTNATIGCWFMPSTFSQPSSGGTMYCERNGSAGNDIFKFGFSGSGFTNQLRFQYRDDAGTLNAIVSDSISNLEWHHVAVVKQGTAIRFYMDGQLIGTGTLTAGDTLTNSVVCQIGNDPRDGNSSFLGLIDEVQIYNTNLTAAQIKNIVNGTIESSCLGFWRFNEGSGSEVIDSTRTQSNGTITSATYSTTIPFANRTSI